MSIFFKPKKLLLNLDQLTHHAYLHNTTTQPTKLRISKPSCIKLNDMPDQIFLAAGISIRFSIELQSFTNCTHEIVASTQKGQEAVLQICFSSYSSLEYPKTLDLGILEEGQTSVTSLVFFNRGQTQKLLSISSADYNIRISLEHEVMIKSGQSEQIKLEYGGSRAGEHKSVIEVSCNGEAIPNIITVVRVIKPERTVLINGQKIKYVSLEDTFFTETRQVKFEIINNSIHPSRYIFAPHCPHEPTTPAQLSQSLQSKHLQLNHPSGCIPPFSSSPVIGTWQYELSGQALEHFRNGLVSGHDEYERDCCVKLKLQIEGEKKAIGITCEGKFMNPCITVDEGALHFYNLQEVKKMTFTNNCSRPVPISFPKSILDLLTITPLTFMLKQKFTVQIALAKRIPHRIFQIPIHPVSPHYEILFKAIILLIPQDSAARSRLSSSSLHHSLSIQSLNSSSSYSIPKTTEEKRLELGKLPNLRQKVQKALVHMPNMKKLTTAGLALVDCDQSQLDFGSILLGSVSKKYLKVRNTGNEPISFRLVTSDPELSKSQKEILVIPGSSVIRCEVVWKPLKTGMITAQAAYILNEHHTIHLGLKGCGLGVELSIKPDKLEFDFEDNASFSCLRNVNIHNGTGVATQFTWEVDVDSPFQPIEFEGTASANSTQFCQFLYTPSISSTQQAIINLKVQNGPTKTLSCIGHVYSPVVRLQPASIFLECPILQQQQISISLINDGANFCAYKIYENREIPELHVAQEGVISPLSSKQLQFEFVAKKPQDIEGLIRLGFRAGHDMVLPFHAKVSSQTILIRGDKVANFGQMPILKKQQQTFTISNLTQQNCALYIECPQALREWVWLEQNSIKYTCGQEFKTIKMLDSTFDLCFIPPEKKHYRFFLNLLSPERNFSLLVTGQAVDQDLLLPEVFHMRKSISEMARCADEIIMRNKSLQMWQWQIISTHDSAFLLTQTKGVIYPKSSLGLEITFVSRYEGQYEEVIEMEVWKDKGVKGKKKIGLVGHVFIPNIQFSKQSVQFGTNTLGEESEAVIMLNSNKMKISRVWCHIPPNEINLAISFPDGNSLTSTDSVISVHIRTNSKIPISFRCKVVFEDSFQQRYPVTLTGTFSNSVLLNEPRLLEHCMIKQSISSFLQIHDLQGLYEKDAKALLEIFNNKISKEAVHLEKFPGQLPTNSKYLKRLLQVVCPHIKLPQAHLLTTVGMQALFQTLIEQGCFLHSISIAMILPYDQNDECSQLEHQKGAKKAWVDFMFQLLKVFWIDRIKIKERGRGTNVINANESSLLGWVRQHNPKASGSSLSQDLSLILKKSLSALGCTKQFKGLSVFHQLKIPPLFSQNTMQSMSARTSILLMAYWHSICWSLNSARAQQIDMKCGLRQSATAEIEMVNPFPDRLKLWWQRLPGQNSFHESDAECVFEGRERNTIPVSFLSKNLSVTNDHMLIYSNHLFQPVWAMFRLTGHTVSYHYEQTVQISCPLYEQLQFQAEVKNIFLQSCTFTLLIRQPSSNERIAFRVMKQQVTLAPGKKGKIPIVFCPHKMATIERELILFDREEGHMVYRLIGSVLIPKVKEQIKPYKMPVFVNQPVKLRIPMSVKPSNSLNSSSQLSLKTQQTFKAQSYESTFDVEIISPHSEKPMCPTVLNVPQNMKLNSVCYMEVMLIFLRRVRNSDIKIILRGRKKADVRVFESNFSVELSPKRIHIEMRARLGAECLQTIPLINPTNQICSFKLCCKSHQDSFFSFSDWSFNVPAKSTLHSFKIIFSPTAYKNCLLPVLITNNKLLSNIELILEGIIIEQPPFRTLTYHLSAGQQQTFSITVVELTPPLKVTVDHEAILDCTNKLNQGQHQLVLSCKPCKIGLYEGNVTFVNEIGQEQWLLLIVDSTKTAPRLIKQINPASRNSIQLRLPLQPICKQLLYQVRSTSYLLQGPKQLQLQESDPAEYMCCLTPFIAENVQIQLLFISKKEDFILQVNCLPCSQSVKLGTLETEINQLATLTIDLVNPLPIQLEVTPSSKSPSFLFNCRSFFMPPKSVVPVLMMYRPVSLGVENSLIEMNTKQHGAWVFTVTGKSEISKNTYTHKVEVRLGNTLIHVPFRNPMPFTITVTFKLENEGENFSLQSQVMTISKGKEVHVPVVVKAKENREYECGLVIAVKEPLVWKIVLEARAYWEDKAHAIQGECFQSTLQRIHTSLEGFTGHIIPSQFKYDLEVPQHFDLPFHVVTAKPNYQTMDCRLHIHAYRPFHALFHLIYHHQDGGKWIYPLDVKVVNNHIFGTLELQGLPGHTSAVGFRLGNRLKEDVQFRAMFTDDSDSCFLVWPKEGILPGNNKQKLLLKVTFVPTEYKRTFKSILVVETKETQWRIEVKGIYEKNKQPS